MESLDILGIIAGLCTSSAIAPQIITTIKKKKAEEVSWFMFIIMMIGNGLWVYYGFAKSDVAIISTNFLSVALNVIMLYLKIKYKEK